jgi:hypothetical protein
VRRRGKALTPGAANRTVCVVPGRSGGSPAGGDRVKLLREAFWRYGSAAGQRWRIHITPIAQASGGAAVATAPTIRIELTDEDAGALAAALAAATEHSRGGGLRMGGRSLLDTSDVAGGLHVSPSTIRSWLSRGGPKGNPFPPPDRRYHGRSYWKRATIEAWLARQR